MGRNVRLDVFGKFEIDLSRNGGRWQVARVGRGMSAPLEVAIPDHLDESEVIGFLEDLWHEPARPGQRIKRVRG